MSDGRVTTAVLAAVLVSCAGTAHRPTAGPSTTERVDARPAQPVPWPLPDEKASVGFETEPGLQRMLSSGVRVPLELRALPVADPEPVGGLWHPQGMPDAPVVGSCSVVFDLWDQIFHVELGPRTLTTPSLQDVAPDCVDGPALERARAKMRDDGRAFSGTIHLGRLRAPAATPMDKAP